MVAAEPGPVKSDARDLRIPTGRGNDVKRDVIRYAYCSFREDGAGGERAITNVSVSYTSC